MTEIVSSMRWSSTIDMTRAATPPTARPIATLAVTATTNASTASTPVTGSETARMAIANSTRPVPSLSRLSPSTMSRVNGTPAGA